MSLSLECQQPTNLHVVGKLLVVPVVELVVRVALLLVVLLLDAEEVSELGAGQLPLLLRGLLALHLLAVQLDEAGALLRHHRHVGGRVPETVNEGSEWTSHHF